MPDEFPLTQETLALLRPALLQWGVTHFRVFPWRETRDPYRILLAEILLHRTQVRQVTPVYERLVSRYPDLTALVAGGREALLEELYSLGLRWRADLLYQMARDIQALHGGQVPREKKALLALPGISDYIAGAVRCFAWNEPELLMDTNTVRIVGRLAGWEIKDSSRRNARFRQTLEILLDRAHPREFNYALLDLAHLICLKRQEPLCGKCPLTGLCQKEESKTTD